MSDFTKFKIGIALALLGVPFTLQPLVKELETVGFLLAGTKVRVLWLFYGTSGLLGLSVYIFALAAVREQPPRWLETGGNVAYACALGVPPLYVLLWASTLLVTLVQPFFNQPLLKHILSFVLGTVSAIPVAALTRFVAQLLAKRDRSARVDQLETAEVRHLDRARELLNAGHYDLSIFESFRAAEAALSGALEGAGVRPRRATELFEAGVTAQIISRDHAQPYHQLRSLRNTAAHKEVPMTASEAETALATAKALLGAMRRAWVPSDSQEAA